jgi:predicted DNA-binding protein
MIRTQIQLTEAQAERLRRRSLETGRSVAALIREAVDASLAESDIEARWERAIRAVESGSEGYDADDARDVARNHDRYLVDAIDGDVR